LTIAHIAKNTNPEISNYFTVIGITSIVNSIIYAYSVLEPNLAKGHDFAVLMEAGMHPYTIIAGLVMVLVILKISLVVMEKLAKYVYSKISLPKPILTGLAPAV